LQVTELEAPHYHELIVHTALVYMPLATSALVIGGGDGYTLTELLKHQNLKKIMQVEIDQVVMDVSARYFPGIAATYRNPRVEVQTYLNSSVFRVSAPHTAAFALGCDIDHVLTL
jgi:spermidine synthase